jgi:alkylation response protein AidB-like acyl-CoA dehydrogenase
MSSHSTLEAPAQSSVSTNGIDPTVPVRTNGVAPVSELMLPPREAAPKAHISAEDAPTWEELAQRFRPIFARIAEGAVEREQTRTLAYEPVAWLREAGFGAVRLPKAYGGLGATLPQLFRLMLELAEADSNISHLFRGHFAFLEGRLNIPDAASHDRWFPLVAKGKILGYAMAERTAHTGGDAKLIREDGVYYVDGTKYYSTGTIYADWIIVTLIDGEERVSVAVPTDAKGVTRLDDWDGFGQRLTGSGTTKFDRVRINDDQIIRRFGPNDFTHNYQKSFLQLILLASAAGVGRAVVRDGIEFVKPRTRAFGIPGKSNPKGDPLVQRVLGKVSSLAFSAETLVLGIAQHLEELYQSAQRGTATEADYVATEIKAYQAQQIVLPQVLEASTLVFEVGGASATSETRRLDRHWRNVRTAASHNPAIHREAAIGDYLLNGTVPDRAWREAFEKRQNAKTAAGGRLNSEAIDEGASASSSADSASITTR